jgi:hypothetical protein
MEWSTFEYNFCEAIGAIRDCQVGSIDLMRALEKQFHT